MYGCIDIIGFADMILPYCHITQRCVSWGVLNFTFNHADAAAGKNTEEFGHWLFFTGIDMFADNPSGGIVWSDGYHNILVSMIVAGIATTIKRTASSLYLGKRR